MNGHGATGPRGVAVALAVAAAAAGGVATVAEPARARAAEAVPARNVLRWSKMAGAETCIGGAELAAAVERRLGRKVFTGGGEADLYIEGRIDRTAEPPGWRAQIRTSDAAGGVLGERELVDAGADCRVVDDELALIVALIIDPDAVMVARAPPPPEAPPAAPPSGVTAAVAPPTAEAPARAGRPWRLAVAGSGIAALGLLPGAALGGRIGATVGPPWSWPVELAAALFADGDVARAAGGSRFSLIQGSAGVCPSVLPVLTVCGGVALGRLHARGFGFDLNEERIELRVDAGVDARLVIPLGGRFHGFLGLGGWVALARPRFVYEQGAGGPRAELYRPPPVAGALQLGIGFEI